MQTFQIPIAISVNTEKPPHELSVTETPFANAVLYRGIARNPWCISLIYEFEGEIIKAYRPNADVMLIIAKDADDLVAEIWAWNMQDRSSATFSMVKLKTGLDPDASYYFCNHYDATVADVITVITNGVDAVMQYAHTAGTITTLTTDLKGLFPASFYNALYLANITEDVVAGDPQPYRVAWSDIGDATTFQDNPSYYTDRTEKGQAITSLFDFNGNILILGKTDQIWTIAPYDAFTLIKNDLGITNHESVVSYNQLFFNYNGKLMAVSPGASDSIFLSENIDVQFASQCLINAPSGVAIPYTRQLMYSAGKRIFTYDFGQQGWYAQDFPEKVTLFSTLIPGTKPAASWVQPVSEHKVMSVARESIAADFVIKYGTKKLCVMNHFAFSNIVYPYDSGNNNASTLEYHTRLLCDDQPNTWKRIMKLGYHGQASDDVDVFGWFGEAPQTPTYTKVGTIAVNSAGGGELCLRKKIGKWYSFYTKCRSKNPSELHMLTVEWEARSQRGKQ